MKQPLTHSFFGQSVDSDGIKLDIRKFQAMKALSKVTEPHKFIRTHDHPTY